MNNIFSNLQASLLSSVPSADVHSKAGIDAVSIDANGPKFSDLLETLSDAEVADHQLVDLSEANVEMLKDLQIEAPVPSLGQSEMSAQIVAHQSSDGIKSAKMIGQNVESESMPIQSFEIKAEIDSLQNVVSKIEHDSLDSLNDINFDGLSASKQLSLEHLGAADQQINLATLPLQKSEVKQASDLLLNHSHQMANSQLQSLSNLNQSAAVSSGSVAMWAAALSSGDIKSIELHDVAREPVNSSKPETFMSTKEESAFVVSRDQSGKNLALAGDADLAARSLGDKKSISSQEIISENFSTQVQTIEPKKLLNNAKAKSAKDFMLENNAWSAPHEAVTVKDMPALLAPQSLGEPGDKRIASDAVNFMATKIEALRGQGGGRLKLELNPAELGAVEIQVSVRGGKLSVNLMADRQETVAAFNASKSVLIDKLSSLGGSDLKISSVSEAGSNGNSIVSSVAHGHPLKNMESSADMLSMRTLSNSHRAQNLQVNEQSGVNHTIGRQASNIDFIGGNKADDQGNMRQNFSQSRPDGSDKQKSDFSGWERDERREQARQKWQDLQERKSA